MASTRGEAQVGVLSVKRWLRWAWDLELVSWRTLGIIAAVLGLLIAVLIAPSREDLVAPSIEDFFWHLGR
jgi:hypothetical protein